MTEEVPYSRRVWEHDSIAEDHRTRWLAAQIDELEAQFVSRIDAMSTQFERMTTKMESLVNELHSTRETMSSNTTRVVAVILTASMTLLVSVIAWIITFVAN